MKRLMGLFLAMLMIVILALPKQTQAVEFKEGDIYVSATGTSGGNGTESSPLDLVTAISNIEAGNTIWMEEGTYKFNQTIEISNTNEGTEDAYKNISNIDGGKVILDFSAMADADSNRGIVLNGKYWHVYGIEITGAGDNGMLLCGDCNLIEMCQFYANRDSGLQISRRDSNDKWPTYNYILNCTSYNNMDSTGEDADGFAAKLTCGEGNVFDGCMSYNNCDDGWDLYAKSDTGPIGVVTIKNCVAFRNGKLTTGEGSSEGDMNGFKLGGSGVGTAHIIENCIAFENGAHGFTDNNNPTAITLTGCTSFNNSVYASGKANFTMTRESGGINSNLLSFATSKLASEGFKGTISYSIYYNNKPAYYYVEEETAVNGKEKLGTIVEPTVADFVSITAPDTSTDFHTYWRNADGSINMRGFLQVAEDSFLNTLASDGGVLGARGFNGEELPESTATPEVTATPDVTSTPAVTETPEVTATPEVTSTPEVTATPEVTNTPEVTVTPEVTETPKVTATPEVTVTPEPTATPEITEAPLETEIVSFILGDVNEDTKVNAEDALLVLKHAAKLESLTKPVRLLAADVNKDEAIDAKDALDILKIAAKIY